MVSQKSISVSVWCYKLNVCPDSRQAAKCWMYQGKEVPALWYGNHWAPIKRKSGPFSLNLSCISLEWKPLLVSTIPGDVYWRERMEHLWYKWNGLRQHYFRYGYAWWRRWSLVQRTNDWSSLKSGRNACSYSWYDNKTSELPTVLTITSLLY